MPSSFSWALIIMIVVVVGTYMWRQYQEQGGSTAVSATTVDYAVVEDDQIDFTLDVSRDNPDIATYCIVRAVDMNRTEVARKSVIIRTSESRTVRVNDSIYTRDRAVAVDVFGCGENPPAYLIGSS